MNGDVIKLEFPAKPDYILAVRLAVSAVAERAGFDIEDIEDLKVATAEACMLLLAACPDTVDIKITVDSGMQIDLSAQGANGAAADDDAAELSRCLLEALVDKCDFTGAGSEAASVQSVSFFKKL
jgi:serine/threonine-protein kinase RsbW